MLKAKKKISSDIQMDAGTVKAQVAEAGKKRQQCRQEISETILIPADFVNLNRMRITYKCGKAQVNLKRTFQSEHLQYLKHIHRLDSVTFASGATVNTAVLTELAPLGLRYLQIGDCNQCTDTDLATLEGFRDLERLNLHCSYNVTDAGLAHLQKLGLLTHLYVYINDSITDAGLMPLTHLKYLETLCIIRHSDAWHDDEEHRHKSTLMWKNWRQFGRPAKLRDLAIVGNYWTNDSIERFARWCNHLPQLNALTLGRNGCIPENRLSHLQQWLGGTLVCGKDAIRWASGRIEKEIVEYMERSQVPVPLWELERIFRGEIGTTQWEKVRHTIIRNLVIRGVLEEIDDGNETKYTIAGLITKPVATTRPTRAAGNAGRATTLPF